MNESILHFLFVICAFGMIDKMSANKNEEEIALPDFVYEIHGMTFNETIAAHKNILLMFYSSLDEKSNILMPMYREAAFNAKQQGLAIHFTKLELKDGEQNNQWTIDKIPKILFYSHGEKYSYTESKTVKGFFKFLKKELSTNYTDYQLNETTIMNNTNLLNESKSILIFLGNPNKHEKEFSKFRRISDDYSKNIEFYWTENTLFFNEFNLATDDFALVVFKYLESSNSFEQGKILVTSDIKELKKKIKLYAKSTLGDFTEKVLERVIDKGVPSSILIYGEGDEEANETLSKKYNDEFDPIAEKYQDILWSYKCDFNNKELDELFLMFRIKKEELPTLIILNSPQPSDDEVPKYKYDIRKGQLNGEKYADFIENWKAGNLAKFESSEATPENPFNEHGVYHVVGNNFKDFLKFEKNLFMLVCSDSDDDKDCFEIRRRFNAISSRFNASTNLIFSFFEPTKNENQLIELNHIPEIIFFPNVENKISQIKLFIGNYSTNEIVEFIKSEAKNLILVEKEITQEEEKLITNEKLFNRKKIDEEEEESNEEDKSEDEGSGEDDQKHEDSKLKSKKKKTINKQETPHIKEDRTIDL